MKQGLRGPTIGAVVATALFLGACTTAAEGPLVVYSGRSKALVEPLIAEFEARTGIPTEVRYGGSAELASALLEEASSSPADLFWAQDAGALGAVHAAGLLSAMPDSLVGRVAADYRNEAGSWIATTGRARTLAYSVERVDTTVLPNSVFELTSAQFNGRVGWAPGNGSFQAFVTGMRQLVGDDETRNWLTAMKANGAKAYANNSSIVRAIASGEIDYGLPNHYYLHRFTAEDPDFPVAQRFFAAGDPGNLMNVAGVGILKSSTSRAEAAAFVSFLLSGYAQQYFASTTHEFPVTAAQIQPGQRDEYARLRASRPEIDLDALRGLDETLDMLRQVDLL